MPVPTKYCGHGMLPAEGDKGLLEALQGTAALMARPAPDMPTLTLIAGREKIVVNAVIEKRMASWPKGRLITIDGAEHELLFEAPTRRQAALDAILAHFDAHLRPEPATRSQA